MFQQFYNISQMKNFDPIGYNRNKWSDPKNTKNNPTFCTKAHSFCNFDYEWADESGKVKSIDQPVNPFLPNISLPEAKEKVIVTNYQSMTEEDLDDWLAQSINRSIGSMLNPQKKFFLPTQNYEQELKHRYRRSKKFQKVAEDETYFNPKRAVKKQKGYLSSQRKKKISGNEICFDYKNLEPKRDISGTPIKVRQMKKTYKKQIKRRNAVLLENDIHYTRFLKEHKKEKQTPNEQFEKAKIGPVIKKDMLYSYNIQSMKRNSCYTDVPNSIIQREYERIKEPQNDFLTSHRALINNQQELHEKYRMLMNQKTTNAVSTIKEMGAAEKGKDKGYSGLGSLTKKQSTYSKPTIINETNSQTKDKKYLQNKVMKFLNDMQVQSENIDEDMARLNIHASEIFLQHPDSRPQIKWIMKAQEKVTSNQNGLAIDCYKQAIILQPELFIPVFNIAVLLQKENMLESARMWFNLASEFETDSENVLFGSSIVAMKQLRYHDSLTNINELIHKMEVGKKKIVPVYYYIRGLCHKELGNHKQAKSDYDRISQEMKPSNYNVLSNFIFSIVFSRIRRIGLKFNCLSYMNFRETLFIILYEPEKKVKDQSQNLIQIADKLVTMSFFSRFSLNLIKKLLNIAVYQEKPKDSIIFSSRDKTSIILNGLVSLKSHEKDFKKPDLVSVLGRGGVIGGGKLQNNISNKPNSWFTTLSNVELITIPKYEFQLFWKGQVTFEMDFKYNFLKNISLFKGLSQCTMFKLCELLEKRTFEKGTILFNDGSYRNELLSKPGKGFGLAKPPKNTDPRFIHFNNISQGTETKSKKRGRSRIYNLIRKHIFKFNELKFNRFKYPGLFIILNGNVEIEDDKGFRCKDIISERDYFGQNLVIESDGFHNYGRMVAQTDIQVYLFPLQKMVWAFNEDDKQKMQQNCKKRQSIQTIRFLRNRFNECQSTKFQCRFNS